MIVDQELAQQIVDHLMGIVQRNVNIMDCRGVILASGQGERIGQFHQGGQQAVQGRHVVEITPPEAPRFAGALPGVMWPIVLRGKVIGVVGVTGEPEEVRSTAQLVKTVTELILEREMFQADYRSEHRLKGQLVKLLLSPSLDVESDEVRTLGELQGYTFQLPRQVLLLRFRDASGGFAGTELHNLFSDRLHEQVLKAVKESPCLGREDVSFFDKKDLLCILRAAQPAPPLEPLLAALRQLQPGMEVQGGLGGITRGDGELHQSYREALFALQYPGGGLRSLYETPVLLDYLLAGGSPEGRGCLVLEQLKRAFFALKDRQELQQTLEALLAHNLNVSAAAAALFLHRNTLRFRLDKLRRALGLDPCRSFQHAMLCKCLLVACGREL